MAANTAYALACLGLSVGLVGRVGADADGEFMKDSLAGVDLSHVVTQGESGRAYILTDPEGERTILVAPNTNEDLKEPDMPWEALAAATYLHLTAFAEDDPLAVQRTIAARVPERVRLSLDPGELFARWGWRALEDILDHLETLLVTETEWQMLGRTTSAPRLGPAPGDHQTGGPGRQTADAAQIPGFSGGTGRRSGGHPGGRRRLCGGIPCRTDFRAPSQCLRAPGQPGRSRQPPGRRPGELPGPNFSGTADPGAAGRMIFLGGGSSAAVDPFPQFTQGDHMGNVQLDTACEGPLALNDNIFELCREFIKPHGDRLFRQVSRYDHYLAEVANALAPCR